METLYHQTNALIQQTKEQFKELEGNHPTRVTIENAIQDSIHAINKNCDKLDIFVLKVPVTSRPHAKMRCDQLKYDSKHLQAALASAQQKRQRQENAMAEREQLLSTRFRSNNETTMIDLDYGLQHNGAMMRSNQGVDEMLNTGVNTLESLRSQRSILKGAKKRIIDMTSTLGLSTHVMKLIDKRVGQDKLIMIGGMIITLLVILFVIVYLT